MLVLCDVFAAAAAWFGTIEIARVAGIWIDPGLSGDLRVEAFRGMLGLSIVIPVAYAALGLYRARRTSTLVEECMAVTQAVAMGWLWIIMLLGIAKVNPGRWHLGLLLINWVLMANVLRIAGRLAMRSLRKHGINHRTAAVIGTGPMAQRLARQIMKSPWTGISISYFVSETETRPARLMNAPVYCGIDATELARTINDHHVDTVFVALSGRYEQNVVGTVETLATSCVDIRIVSQINSLQLLRQEVSQVGDLIVVSLTDSPQHGWRGTLVKRCVDVIGAMVALVVLSPLMLLISLLVKLSHRGPIFYRQKRVSMDGRPFGILKFRSMPVNVERGQVVWGSQDDPRATRIGGMLRRWSLDELPQLVNVLSGSMSLVGPRPERPELIEQFKGEIPRYMLRHHVKAGMTGWAQVNGLRGQTSLRKRIQYDLYYIRNWSLLFDLYILCITPFRMIGRRGKVASAPAAVRRRRAVRRKQMAGSV